MARRAEASTAIGEALKVRGLSYESVNPILDTYLPIILENGTTGASGLLKDVGLGRASISQYFKALVSR